MLVKDLKNGLKLQNRIAQKDFLEVSLKKNLFPKEVTSIAKKLSKGCDKKLKTEARKILKNRISEKNKDIKRMRSEWDKTSRECRQVLHNNLNAS